MNDKFLHEVMETSIEKARQTMRRGEGGPFGAAVLDKNGCVVSVSSNTVLKDHDPTAHAEINAIREACKTLGTHDLSGCVLLATGYPCPMCLSAIIWANIQTVYYGCTPQDADHIGFRDDFIYDYIRRKHKDFELLEMKELDRAACLELFHEYHETAREMY